MKKIRRAAVAAGLGFLGLSPVHAADYSKGFDVMPSFYQARDNRVRAWGTNFGFNFRIDDSLMMGYRLELLHGYAEDVAGGVWDRDYGYAIDQGITLFYRTLNAAHAGVDVGMFTGVVKTGPTDEPVEEVPRTSPFIEPMARVMYDFRGDARSHVQFGLGYRFVRGFSAIPAAFGAGTRTVSDLDGLDLTFGIGLSFE